VTAQDGETTETYTVVISVVVGVEDAISEQAIIYYNPLIDRLVIDNSSFVEVVEIFSISGKKMLSMKAHGETSLSINTSQLNNGVYMVTMKTNKQGIQIEKFVK